MTLAGPTHVVAEGGLDQLKRIQRLLGDAGIVAEIVAPPAAKCSS
jgi:hypothetical protein